MAPGQLVEKLLVEFVAFLATARGHEDVASDEFMNNFAVGSHTAKRNVDVAFKLDGHLSRVRSRGGKLDGARGCNCTST